MAVVDVLDLKSIGTLTKTPVLHMTRWRDGCRFLSLGHVGRVGRNNTQMSSQRTWEGLETMVHTSLQQTADALVMFAAHQLPAVLVGFVCANYAHVHHSAGEVCGAVCRWQGQKQQPLQHDVRPQLLLSQQHLRTSSG
jgi:hypothetical protein